MALRNAPPPLRSGRRRFATDGELLAAYERAQRDPRVESCIVDFAARELAIEVPHPRSPRPPARRR